MARIASLAKLHNSPKALVRLSYIWRMKLRYFFSTLFVGIVISHFTAAQNFNRPIPNGLFPYEYAEASGYSNGYLLAAPFKLQASSSEPNYISPYPVIFDSDGYVAWYSKPTIATLLDFKYFESIDRYVYTGVEQGEVFALILDNQLNVVDTLITNAIRDVHDLQLAANGNWLITTLYLDTMDLSAYTFNGTQGSTQTVVKGFGYEEIDPAGTLINSWNSNDFISTTETYDYWGYSANVFDYCHGNAIQEDVDGNLLLSHRHLNSIHKIDRQTGAILWRLGGEMSDFTFVNDPGFSGQHDIRKLPNGDYSIFDNGNMTGVTRAVSYTLDTVNWTATKSNEYLYPAGATSTAMGNYQTTASGMQVVGYGLIYRPEPNAVIIDANENELAAYYFQDSIVSYRFLHFDLTLPERPEIVCNWNGNNWELVAPAGQTAYAWSNGATTSTIPLTQAGTYQVWVDQGAGMLGSLPIQINDINNPCSLAIDDLSSNEGTFEWYDVLGVRIEKPKPNTVYLKVFASGRIEKIIYTAW